MENLRKKLFSIVRQRCISDYCANLVVSDIIEFYNNLANKCECDPEIKTGNITQTVCNICGLTEK